MYTYALTQARDQYGEVFERALVEPVLITQQEEPSHVVLSIEAYQQLLNKLEALEDQALGQAAQQAEQESKFVGSEVFTQALAKFANA